LPVESIENLGGIMDRHISIAVGALGLIVMLLLAPSDLSAQIAEQAEEHAKMGHQIVSGVVKEIKSDVYTLKTPTGLLTLSLNQAERHGHGDPKVGDEMTLLVNENNAVIDAHPKGQEGRHAFVTGKLIRLDRMDKRVKLSTAQGEKTFPIERLELKAKGLEEGAQVTVELNEAGTAIDVHRAESSPAKH
jgi:hypothetical protein